MKPKNCWSCRLWVCGLCRYTGKNCHSVQVWLDDNYSIHHGKTHEEPYTSPDAGTCPEWVYDAAKGEA